MSADLTDRELLEAAAKAAGIELRDWYDSAQAFNLALSHSRSWWNPLTDDGDALRLAVKLRLRVKPPNVDTATVFCVEGDVLLSAVVSRGEHYAATRRAIVRAAAEIGRAKG
jgi:hypothetical protein